MQKIVYIPGYWLLTQPEVQQNTKCCSGKCEKMLDLPPSGTVTVEKSLHVTGTESRTEPFVCDWYWAYLHACEFCVGSSSHLLDWKDQKKDAHSAQKQEQVTLKNIHVQSPTEP